MLIPQHWAQTLLPSRRPQKGQAPEMTFHNRVELQWDGLSKKTVYLDLNTNVATFTFAPNFMKYNAFCAQAKIQDEAYKDHPICHEAGIVSDDEYKDDSDLEPEEPVPRTVHFDLDGPIKYTNKTQPTVIVDEE